MNDKRPWQKKCFKLRVFLVSEQRCIDGSCHGLLAEKRAAKDVFENMLHALYTSVKSR